MFVGKNDLIITLLSTLWGLLVIIPSILILTGGLVLINMWLWYSVILGVACMFGSLAWFAIVAVIGDEKIGGSEKEINK